MKLNVRITAALSFLFAIILSCTKEVDLKTEVEFQVTVEHNEKGYIDENLSTVITVVPEEVLEDFSYTYSYSVSKGEGYFTDRSGEVLPQDESVSLDPFSASVKYVGAKSGDHMIKVTASDNYGFFEEVDVAYIVEEIPPVVWTATSPLNQIELGKSAVIRVHFEKSAVSEDMNYERRYRISGGLGELTETPDREKIALDEYADMVPGTYQLNFIPSELGAAEVSFDLKGDDGAVLTNTLVFDVLEDIEDIEPPVITLLGDNPYIVQRKTEYTDPGATALDDVDGDISASIGMDTSGLNMARTGIYEVIYRLSDSSGNVAEEVV